MSLKYEKTYMTSVLLAKKRYTGNIFGSGQLNIQNKGIELVRRDNCRVVQRVLREAL